MKIRLTKINTAFTHGFQKDFQKLEISDQQRIKKRLHLIFNNPEVALIKKLTHYPLAQYRLRISPFGLLFFVDEKIINFFFSNFKKRKDLYYSSFLSKLPQNHKILNL